ncbi:MAG: PKD domain-containing protein [Gammaproteobacteria bacterium]|nr:PKD domain-containing protein [Gammaproteobacteria bacterium]
MPTETRCSWSSVIWRKTEDVDAVKLTSVWVNPAFACLPGSNMTQVHSVCRKLSALMQAGAAGLLESWQLVAIASVVCWAGNVVADSGYGFSPHLILVVDESGSMRGRHDWLADAIPALGQALNDRNVNSPPDQLYFTLAGFTTRSRDLAQRSSEIDAARAVRTLRTDGGTEDGYVAIRDVLSGYLSGNEYSPTTVILITDEDRDETDRELTLSSLSNQLVLNGIVVHAVTRARIVCPDRREGIAIDRSRVAVVAGQDDFSTCSDARVKTVRDYVELAHATGGLVWSLDMIAGFGEKKTRPETLQQFVNALSDRVIMQWPTGALWADIDHWPETPHSGDVVTFDGSNSLSAQPGGQISDWKWDLDGDGTIDQNGSTVARIFSAPGRYRVVLYVTDKSNPPSTGRKVLFLQISE